MKRYSFLLLFALLAIPAVAQKTEGVVTYERRSYWTKIYGRMTYLSQEQKDRIAQTWKNDEEGKEKMKLTFSPDASLYTYVNEMGSTDDGRYTWRNKELLLYRNFAKDQQIDVIEMLGKTYIVEDSLRTPVWKIGNQIKEVAGYICMRAETEDPVKKQKITAWFAQDIPVPAGPERISGLPGLILELNVNDGDVIIEATSVTFKPVEAEALKLSKSKGKKINVAAYDALIGQYIAEQTAAHQNPFWEIRY